MRIVDQLRESAAFLRRFAQARVGGALQKTISRLLDSIETRRAQGMDECTVSYTDADVGLLGLDTATPAIVDALQDAGHAVTRVTSGPHRVDLQVRPGHTPAGGALGGSPSGSSPTRETD